MNKGLYLLAMLLLIVGCSGDNAPTDTAPIDQPPAADQPTSVVKPDQDPGQPPEAPAPIQGGCPEGLFEIGAEPPAGFEKYCHKLNPDMTEVKHGPYAKWYADGKPEAKGQYAENLQTGPWIEWKAEGGKCEGEYVDGLRSGVWTISHANGTREVGPFVKGVREGQWTTYWGEDDRKKEQGVFVKDERQGLWSYFDEHGQQTPPDQPAPQVDGQ